MTHTMKSKFAGMLRGWLRHFEEGDVDTPAKARSQDLALASPEMRPEPEPVSAPLMPPPPRPAANGAGELKMPLLPILEKLPSELRGKMTMSPQDLGQASISIPIDQILPQLALGSVKIAFGQLREAAPSLFQVGEEYDSLPAVLPLNSVLSQLKPGLLTRNPVQKSVSVPADITGPFGVRPDPFAAASPAPAPAPAAAPTPVRTPAPQKSETQFKPRMSLTPATPAPVSPRPAFGSSALPAPAVSLAAPASAPARPPNGAAPRVEAPKIPVTPPKAARWAAPAPASPASPAPLRMAPAIAMPAPQPPQISGTPVGPAVQPAGEQKTISVPLSALSERWPETLRNEIAQWNLGNAQVALPVEAVAPGLKRGRITLAWRHLRSWMRPPPPSVPSAHDAEELDLPLKAIAPLFMQQQSAGRQQTRLTVDKSIPNLFFGFPSPEMEAPVVPAVPATPPAAASPVIPPPAAVVESVKPVDAKLSETNYYVWGDSADTPRVDASEYKRPQAPATDFTSRYATPKDIVARAKALNGVDGALVALPDGLMVACQLPPSLNADTVAAFLPQIYDRVAQCTRELRMGALNNLKFTVGNVPWSIFRVNAVYFAVFGRAGESLPKAQLAALAAELDRKKS